LAIPAFGTINKNKDLGDLLKSFFIRHILSRQKIGRENITKCGYQGYEDSVEWCLIGNAQAGS
jgi:hypothetical protein